MDGASRRNSSLFDGGRAANRGGQQEGYCHRRMLDAIRYLVGNGIKRRAMPADFPPWDRVDRCPVHDALGMIAHTRGGLAGSVFLQ
ncbi:transposase [Streptomyces sparsogenes]|uniref:transposase n=1 Tax=Streptomyces sparsogenes TaxID=67365 RepID=UPI0033DFE42B